MWYWMSSKEQSSGNDSFAVGSQIAFHDPGNRSATDFCRERPPWRSVNRKQRRLPRAERHGGRSLQRQVPPRKGHLVESRSALGQPRYRLAVVDEVRPVGRIVPGRSARYSKRLVDRRSHVLGLLRVQGRAAALLVG